jgi:hypothetical protein
MRILELVLGAGGVLAEARGIGAHDVILEKFLEALAVLLAGLVPIAPEHEARDARDVEALLEHGAEFGVALRGRELAVAKADQRIADELADKARGIGGGARRNGRETAGGDEDKGAKGAAQDHRKPMPLLRPTRRAPAGAGCWERGRMRLGGRGEGRVVKGSTAAGWRSRAKQRAAAWRCRIKRSFLCPVLAFVQERKPRGAQRYIHSSMWSGSLPEVRGVDVLAFHIMICLYSDMGMSKG